MYCKKCNRPIEEDSAFCRYCGTRIETVAELDLDVINSDKALQESFQYMNSLNEDEEVNTYSISVITEEVRKLQTDTLRELLNTKILERYKDDSWKMDFYSNLQRDNNNKCFPTVTPKDAWKTIKNKGTTYSTNDMDVTLIKFLLLNDFNKGYLVWVNDPELRKRIRAINVDRQFYGHRTYSETDAEEVMQIMKSVGNVLLLINLLSEEKFYGYGSNRYYDILLQEKLTALKILKKLKYSEGSAFSSFRVSVNEAKLNEARSAFNYAITKDDFTKIVKNLEDLSDNNEARELIFECDRRIRRLDADDIIEKARSLMQKDIPEGYQEALIELNSIREYEDAAALIEECNKKLKKIKQKKKMKIGAIIGAGLATIIAIVILSIVVNHKDKYNLYNADYLDAVAAFENDDIETALDIFQQLNGYKDSEKYIDQLTELLYEEGVRLFDDQKYGAANSRFIKINDYKDSAEYISKAQDALYDEAVQYFAQNQDEEALAIFESLENFKDSNDYLLKLQYRKGEKCIEERDFSQAENIFNHLGTYEDSKKKLEEIHLLRIKYASNLSIGDWISIGKYDNLDIRWTVLDKNDDYLLLISSHVLMEKKMDSRFSITWDNCDLHDFLNDAFYNSVFSLEEKNYLVRNSETSDWVTLLSEAEFEKYYLGNGRGADYSLNQTCWLRKFTRSGEAIAVLDTGKYQPIGFFSYNDVSYGVRPVIRIKVN